MSWFKKVIQRIRYFFRKDLSPDQVDLIVNQVLDALAKKYEVEELTPSKGELIEHQLHPISPNHVIAKYKRPDGFTSHTIEVPHGLSPHQLVDFLKKHEAANLY